MFKRFFPLIGGSVCKWALPIISLACFCGCGDFFAQKPTEIQTQVTLNELRQIKENPAVRNPLPELYRSPPKRIKVKDGVKLFYFTRNHTVDKLSALITQQLGLKTSLSSPTNQLIIHCADDQEANKALEFLNMVDVPPIQVNIDCLIFERFADVTMDWETTLKIENILGEKITLGGNTPTFPGASLREPKRSNFGLDFGFWRNKEGVGGPEFRTMVDLLVSRGYLKILMNPVLETVNGQKATISARDWAPYEQVVTPPGVNPYSMTNYQWVVDSLEVTPYVFVDGSIGLATTIKLGSRSKPEGVVQTSIITERSVEMTDNRIKPGDSLIIGGLRKTTERSVIRGVPFLKDIPVLGILFSSKDFEETGTEVTFILTPSISSGGIEHAKMIKQTREKLAAPKYDVGLGEVLSDPLGVGIYTERVEQRAAKAEFEQLRSEIEKAEALEEVNVVKYKLLNTAEQVLTERAKAAQAQTEAQAAEEAAKKAKEEAERVQAEAQKTKADAIKAEQDAEKARADAQKAKTEAEGAKAEAEKAKGESIKAGQESQKAKEDAEKAKAEVEGAKAEAEKAKEESIKAGQESQKAKEEAEKAKAETNKAKEEAQKAKAEAEKAKAEAQKAKEEAEKAKAEKAKEEADKAAEKAEP